MSSSIDFEPEVVFPSDSFGAARMFLALMAYPEKGAGQPGEAGAAFAAALLDYALWSTRKFKGLKWMRAQFGDRSYLPPRREAFEGLFSRGMRRVDRRLAAYDMIGTQLINGFFAVRRAGAKALAEGRPDDAFVRFANGELGPARPELWRRVTPSYRRVLRINPKRWEERLALNKTGNSADSQQRLKDLQRRAFHTSVPVLHMAHALNQAARENEGRIKWAGRHPALALMMNAELWITSAISDAEQWREATRYHITPDLRPELMIHLLAEKTG